MGDGESNRGYTHMEEHDEVRVAKTEAIFREVNERIAERAEQFDSAVAGFVCECADPSCTERIEAPLAEYEQVRADGATFLTLPGHEVPALETVRPRTGFQIVHKIGNLGAFARRLDPRASTA